MSLSRSQPGASSYQGARGFSLVELMVAVAVVAIMATVAYPAMTGLLNDNRLAGAANEALAGLQLSRATAISRNARVVFCRSANGTSCVTTAGNWEGWVAFVDANGDFAADAAADVLRSGTFPGSLVVQSSSNAASNRIVFRPDGMARLATGGLVNATLSFCIATTNPAQNIRNLEFVAGSRGTVRKAGTGDGRCTAPANPT